MGEFEEETYSTVFKALKHPVRRRLLRVLSQGSRTFTDLQSSFKVNGAVLTFHLDAMKDLISKTEDGKYSLSTMGEGAMALMERVEEPPKATPTNPSPKSSRRLNILQLATICIAIVLLVSGTYLASISSIQDFYDVYAGWSVTHAFVVPDSEGMPEFYNIEGNFYDIRYSLFVNPRNQLLDQLTKEHEADIYVNLKTNETTPSALYFVTLTYSEYSPAYDSYQRPKQQTYQGEFQPVKSPSGLAFSTHLTLPQAYLQEQLLTVAQNIRVNIWTNTTLSGFLTDAIMADFISVKASATEEFGSETRPYEIQGNIITIIGIILLVAALMMSILSLLRKSYAPSFSTEQASEHTPPQPNTHLCRDCHQGFLFHSSPIIDITYCRHNC
jgi:DNA-binding transcriptional ArsR family regulator